ncbi:uncharacterized protein CC84DRAFT_1201254 [Paraphaeosphaeria sporulosa]|uniref:Uncharacterized protein n=1 Tax=Paraphaeosphaeria sporulosa TaxID=1460663 RepID=A0A177CYA7_9PLEO|nr:uncharacterized protein CC84DRAFT_1201254 [Paraphaeosphaeria sporulosa]OAG12191.1 hypothetical protein CC84DRAFT_1201254 [Paraphaeosphaeria sporulosa]
MPNTRSGNKTANFKAYFSKKAAPHQQHFPHWRKVVRRPDPHDDGGKKQMKFLPEMMRRRSTVQDSDDEGGESVEDEDVEEVQRKRAGKKRNSDVMCEMVKVEEDSEEDPVQQTPKRRRKDALVDTAQRSTKRRRAAAAVAQVPESEASDETEQEVAPKPRLRRQSTMTQIVDGRSPGPGSIEPDFKPFKRTPRTSWGGKGNKKDTKKDVKQRTLTQMVHTMTPLVLDSDEEVEGSETDEEVDAAYHSFIYGNEEEAGAERHAPAEFVEEGTLSIVEGSFQVAEDDSGEDEYQPTQFIEAPAKKSRRTPLRSSIRLRDTPASKSPASASPKTRFGLLSTPEKRGVFEIASSQSPPETLLSTQNTPQRSGRRPLKPRSVNVLRMAETPSKRGADIPSKRKQVTFQDGPQEQIPPPALRKFASTIPDSEDELGDLSESDGQFDVDGVRQDTQARPRDANGLISGADIGEETQAMLLDIDRACANPPRNTVQAGREKSEELGEPIDRYDAEASQELGLQSPSHPASSSTNEKSSEVSELPPLPFSSPKPCELAAANEEPGLFTDNPTTPTTVHQLPSSPPIKDFRTQSPTMMFAEDETPEEADEPVTAVASQPSTPTKQLRSSPVEDFRTNSTIPMFDDDQPSEDLDDVPTATPAALRHPDIQVFRSPPAHLRPEPSHSSQAEQQLHSEYQTYSQYRRPAPFPSSMHVAHDSHYSYQATPRPLPKVHSTQFLPDMHFSHVSQATTVGPTQISPKTTPQKPKVKIEHMFPRSATQTPKRHRQDRSATTTPKSLRAFGLPMSSPDASHPPPTLFIPSSFPSPARVTMDGWSSPVFEKYAEGESQWGVGSLDEFSIPAPPPEEWVEEDEDGEL